jgi:uncharacterized protein YgbK (DUF1537 family)
VSGAKGGDYERGGTAAQVAVLADDLTGAADSGVMFANHGLTTMVVWSSSETARAPTGGPGTPAADVRVISSESRECDRPEAVRRVRWCVQRYIQPVEAAWVYKKIDSTLRGHPGAELAALVDGIGSPRVLVAPAFPEQGRTTVGGVHRVHGVRLDKTVFGEHGTSAEVVRPFVEAFGSDAVTSLSLEVVRSGVGGISDALEATGARVVVADAETPEDLKALVLGARQGGIHVLCGSAGLASALGSVVTWQTNAAAPDVAFRQGTMILVVAASRHPRTRDQVLALLTRGVRVVAPPVEWFTDPSASAAPVVRDLMMLGTCQLCRNSPVVLTTVGLPTIPAQGSLMTRKLGRVVRDLVETGRLAGMVLTGGDTAIAAADALEVEALWLRGEVRSGIPWGLWLGGAGEGLPVVTKAGGFGETDALIAAVDHIRNLSRDRQ